MWYFGHLTYAEIKLLSQIKLDTILRNSFVTGLIITWNIGLWKVILRFQIWRAFEWNLQKLLHFKIVYQKCILILLIRLMESVDDFLCFAATEGNSIFVHEYS